MSTRYQRRKTTAETKKIIKNAKIDMERYLSGLSAEPTLEEAKAWQAGYLAGINRANGKIQQ
jgi:hypothetical protein